MAAQQNGGPLLQAAAPPPPPQLHTAFSSESVMRLREQWFTPEFSLQFVTFCHACQFPDVHMRLKLEEIGGVELAMDVIRDGRDPALMGRAWIVLQNFVLVNRVDDLLEMRPIDIFVERGGVELACTELNRAEPRWTQTILTALAWISTNEKAVPRVVASGAHKVGIRYIRDQHPQHLDISMSFIRSTSAAAGCRTTLRADGALEAFLPFMDCNNSTEPFQMRRGFRAASIVARLAGNDETGVGPQILRNNPSLISTTLKIFSMVLDAGPHGTVVNMLVNPHFITMDLLIISTADVNKPLLAQAIPICMAALRLRGTNNGPMVEDIVKMFLQLSFEPTCRRELIKVAPELNDLLKTLVPPPGQHRLSAPQEEGQATAAGTSRVVHNRETYVEAQHLMQSLLNQPAASASPSPTSGAVGIGRFVRRIVSSYASGSLMDTSTSSSPSPSPTAWDLPAIPTQHVMLSYFYHSASTVKKLDEVLRIANVNVWVDFRNMGTHVSESMEEAISRAALMVVFVSPGYKQSATCRKEVEAAEGRGVPLLFIQVDPNYKPDGWLASCMAMGQVVEGWGPTQLQTTCVSKIIERAGPEVIIRAPSRHYQRDGSSGSESSFEGSKGRKHGRSNSELAEAFTALSATVKDLRRELLALKEEVKHLREQQQGGRQPH